MDDNRMNKALELGATDKVNAADPDFIEKIKALSPDGLGVDVAIEAVGVPQTFETCTKIVRPTATLRTRVCTASQWSYRLTPCGSRT